MVASWRWSARADRRPWNWTPSSSTNGSRTSGSTVHATSITEAANKGKLETAAWACGLITVICLVVHFVKRADAGHRADDIIEEMEKQEMPFKMPEGCPLTQRQYEVILLIGEGHQHPTIAHRLGVKAATSRGHAHEAYQRLGVRTAAEAILKIVSSEWWANPTPASTGPIADEGPLPWGLKLYLRAFDRHLRARGEPEEETTRHGMMYMFGAHSIDAGIPLPLARTRARNVRQLPRNGKGAPLERIARAIAALP